MKRSLEAGFTLIEIVMVLVLLGILAGVAAPKFFDLRDTAEEKAAQAVAAEVQARLNGEFADAILKGTPVKEGDTTKTSMKCSDAQTAAMTAVNANGAFGSSWTVGSISAPSNGSTVTIDITNNSSGKKYPVKIEVPICK